VADQVLRRGHYAPVEQTGDNTPTINVGRQVPDRYGRPRWSAAGGPGRFETPGWTNPFADTTEFRIGPTATTPGACRYPRTPPQPSLFRQRLFHSQPVRNAHEGRCAPSIKE